MVRGIVLDRPIHVLKCSLVGLMPYMSIILYTREYVALVSEDTCLQASQRQVTDLQLKQPEVQLGFSNREGAAKVHASLMTFKLIVGLARFALTTHLFSSGFRIVRRFFCFDAACSRMFVCHVLDRKEQAEMFSNCATRVACSASHGL